MLEWTNTFIVFHKFVFDIFAIKEDFGLQCSAWRDFRFETNFSSPHPHPTPLTPPKGHMWSVVVGKILSLREAYNYKPPTMSRTGGGG